MRKVYPLLYGTEDITADREFMCGLPSDIQGWGGHRIHFHEMIKQTDPKLIIEVGSWKGKSAICMADLVSERADLKDETEIVCVDTFLGATEMLGAEIDGTKRDLKRKNGFPQIYQQFMTNVIRTGHEKRITPFPQTSTNAARFLKKHNIQADLIYVDASHEYDDVRTDLESYYQLLRVGGILFGDDYCEYWQGVVDAVDETFPSETFNVNHKQFPNPDGQAPSDYWWIVKP